ncbi:MAG: hypothetical protein AAGD00_05545 [Planctomycetota bacterium]
MSRTLTVGAAAVVLLCAGSASGALLSFASDVDSGSFTFGGIGNTATAATDPTDPFKLLIDDDNGPLDTLEFDVNFESSFTIAYNSSVQLFPGVFLHIYELNGDFLFRDQGDGTGSGEVLLEGTITNGAFTALGGPESWSSTGTIQGNDTNDSESQVSYTWRGDDLPDYDLFADMKSIGPDDASFTLTAIFSNLMQTPASGVPLGSDFLPADDWESEGSFSGQANIIPTPASTALAICAFAMTATRRRR